MVTLCSRAIAYHSFSGWRRLFSNNRFSFARQRPPRWCGLCRHRGPRASSSDDRAIASHPRFKLGRLEVSVMMLDEREASLHPARPPSCTSLHPARRTGRPDRRPVRGGLPGGRRHLDLDRAQARPSSQRSARHPTRCLGGKRMRALFEVNVSAKLKMQSQIVPRQLHEEEPLDLRTPRLVRPWRQRSGGRGV